ncbi:hypothetical protein [Merismopedia glauca]
MAIESVIFDLDGTLLDSPEERLRQRDASIEQFIASQRDRLSSDRNTNR